MKGRETRSQSGGRAKPGWDRGEEEELAPGAAAEHPRTRCWSPAGLADTHPGE